MPTSCASGFEALGLPEPILRAVRELGYLTPTPIQARAIPVVLEGRDVMGRAQTGTGKTAAFALPILARLAKYANSSPSPARHPVRALILAPTRELAIQIGQNVAAYGKYTGLRSTVVYGGVDIREQEKAVRAGVEVLVATPGRLLDHHEQRNVFLNYLEVLVLDEADRMLDMGFLPDIHRILALLPRERQSLLFSATFPEEIRELADRMLRSPAVIEVARRSTAAETVTQRLYRVAAEDKRRLLAHLVRSENLTQVLVFCRSKAETARLARALAREGFSTTELHGDKTQEERLKALEAFKSGAATIMVATDVAARGLDIEELPVVVNYELPFVAEDYVHRIGRTGRAGASGVAISFVSPEEERLLEEIERLIKRTIKVVPLPDLAQRPERGNVATRAGASEAKDRPRDPKHFANNPDQPPARPVPIGARTRRPSEICALLRPPAHTSPAPSPRAPALERVEHDHLQDVSA
ncbi:MAG: DEAD/DEAH box helicase [Casimicrobiaceae bacterium]|nr:DEAD/DEAH box helicase [Casimicrobiaceae bacterium]